RFDGVVLSYKPSATVSFDLTGGYLIDSSFNSPDTNRPFVGVSGEYVNQSGNITIEPFLMQQYVDGILDRRALGVQAELRFDQAVLYTLVDYDIHHSALNNATLMGNFRIGEMRVSTSFAHRKSPYLTTRNALIGQLSVDLSELEEAILDIKLKDLADDRTATSNTARVSLTSNVSEHWLISTEVAASSFSKTESSIDIVGLDSYKSIYSSFQIRTTDIFGAASYTALTLRRADTDSGSTSSLFLDNRINMGKHWRVYPRVRLDLRDFDESDDKQWTMNPSIRLDYKHGQRFRFQAEAGYTWVTRGMVNQDLDISGVFFRLGYSASF
ncbi:MAG: hypothetical protein KUG75_14240, partial [Pseudomonadales bacterium]|nr:hypothetical protein [Pseudomonadales bacterium]